MALTIYINSNNKRIYKHISDYITNHRVVGVVMEIAKLFKKEFIVYKGKLCLIEDKFKDITDKKWYVKKKMIANKLFMTDKVLEEKLHIMFWKEIEEGKLKIVRD